MAAEIGLLNLTQLQKITQSQQPPPVPEPFNPSSSSASSWMWNTREAAQDDDDSWEVKAFEEDTANILGATWPPRSYTCTFCRREFRSAQALGGHMNVHRRDRARELHQTSIGSNKPPSSSNFASPFVIPPQEFVTSGGGLCFLYSLPTPDGVLAPTIVNSCINSPSSLLPISPHVANNLASPPCPPLMNLQLTPHTTNSSVCHSCNTEHSPSEFSHEYIQDNSNCKEDSPTEEIDLELRLGRRSSTP